MLKDEYKVYEEKMKKSIESVMSDFDTVRAGRANASVLNRISVDYYGTPRPSSRSRRSAPPTRGRWSSPRGTPVSSRGSRRPFRSLIWASTPRTTASASGWAFPS